MAENTTKTMAIGDKNLSSTENSNCNTDDNSNDHVISENGGDENRQGSEDEDESQYPVTCQLVVITFAPNLSMFLVGLENTIISTAVPKITDQFHAMDDVGWYASAYLLTCCQWHLMWGSFTHYTPSSLYT
ncbi:hypothetical protein BGW36DRAFT_360699 [Talaromyces proteolyticus]|uniref:Major facilitator superfamily (MFS) profile domain-containing protein n=1 Tax=Talaromyces proteolyticus TaxID=1131652 RepID=A0AAD4KLU9_9EURO|nr:uncharacterized protein BGW36DRAFT_360699 [Talaromyces proteolyticus]KAH8694980.1 hypothetical protein BGW36DRAFT_360699 [Talaromyces proteolyticus]